MAGSMIGGVLAQGWNAENIWASDPDPATRTRLASLGIHVTEHNREAAAAASIVVLAVKPQQLRSACLEIAAAVAYLASDEARYVTGVAFSIDGGQMT